MTRGPFDVRVDIYGTITHEYNDCDTEWLTPDQLRGHATQLMELADLAEKRASEKAWLNVQA